MNTSKAPTEVVEKYGNYADKLTDKDIREAAIKRVEAGKKEIPEADKAKFEKVARIAIQDVNEGI
ncbi:MAG: hypothetical protein LBP53_00030 [Candidatus Peribacteria bacterium]|nr:hypothetical protein [Candidatus Peribacteria bacterium]